MGSRTMYLGGDSYVRKDKLAAGDAVLPPGQQPDRHVRVRQPVL